MNFSEFWPKMASKRVIRPFLLTKICLNQSGYSFLNRVDSTQLISSLKEWTFCCQYGQNKLNSFKIWCKQQEMSLFLIKLLEKPKLSVFGFFKLWRLPKVRVKYRLTIAWSVLFYWPIYGLLKLLWLIAKSKGLAKQFSTFWKELLATWSLPFQMSQFSFFSTFWSNLQQSDTPSLRRSTKHWPSF